MSDNAKLLGLKAATLKRGLLISYLSLAGVGLGLLVVGLITNLWLRDNALEIVEASAPRVELLERINIGIETSKANLHAWIAENKPHYRINQKKAWKETIYPSLIALKKLDDKNKTQLDKIQSLEEALRNLEMWQWHIDDVAQTSGNLPAQFIYDSQINVLIPEIVASTNAIHELTFTELDSNDNALIQKLIFKFRTSIFISFRYLKTFVFEGSDYSKYEFNQSTQKADSAQQSLLAIDAMFSPEQLEQFSILNNSFSAYKYFSTRVITARESNDWNVARNWLNNVMSPLSTKVEEHLAILLDKEKLTLKKNALNIQWIGYVVPIIMLALLVIMIVVAFYLTRKGTKDLIGPVVALEKQDQLKSDLAILNNKMLGVSNIKQLCQQVIDYLTEQVNATAGAFFVEKENVLQLSAGYALPKNTMKASDAIEPGVGIIGQVYASNKSISLAPESNETFNIQSSLIETTPKTILVSPIEFENNVIAVLELASLRNFSTYEKEFLQLSLNKIGVSLNAIKQKERIQQALEQAQTQSEELLSQKEELRVTNEELENQKEELRVTNEELHLKGETLEKQSKDLEKSNTELETKSQYLLTQANVLKKAQTDAEEKARQLEESGRYKSEFLANMSHELRTPLNSLLILSKMLAENDEENLTDDQIESATVIYDSGSHLLNLINDILDLSKIEAGRMEVTNETVLIADLAQSMSIRFSHMAKDKAIKFIVDDLDEATEFIISDGIKIQQILTNLIGNSIKFTQEGSVSLKFGLVKSEDILPEYKKILAIAVKDTGIGIEEEKQKAIFEAFQQEDGSTSRNYGGTGLGLSISLAYARLLGGDIQLKSKKGEGSTFTLYLPLQHLGDDAQITTTIPHMVMQDNHEVDHPVAKQDVEWTLSASPFTDDREILDKKLPLLLVIEDDPKFSRILYNESKSLGYQCIVAPDAESGLLLVMEHEVSGILLDLCLPGMDGEEFLNRLTTDAEIRHIPVHVISALDNAGEEIKQGAVGYFTKPVSKKQINEAIAHLSYHSGDRKGRILLVEDDDDSRKAIVKLLDSEKIEVTEVSLAAQATKALKSTVYDSVILDLGLPDKNGFDWLEEMEAEESVSMPPVIIYSGRELSDKEETRLRAYTDSIIIKSERSTERLWDEVSLFLHSVKKSAIKGQSLHLESSNNSEIRALKDKRVLIVDDDMRNTFALSKALRKKGMVVEMASGGEQALEKLAKLEQFNIVLMDIMMPGMDGYETTREIRKQGEFRDLSIIAVTAKAMKGDKEKCLEAGANDYLSKPIDMDELQTSMLIWL